MKSNLISYLIFIGYILSSCKRDKLSVPNGVWLNSNLDQIEFVNEGIILGYGFAIPPDTLSCRIIADSVVVVVPTQVYGDATDAFKLRFTFEVVGEDTLLIKTRQNRGYFARGKLLNTYIASNKIFKSHEWDSLVQYKYTPEMQYADYPFIEKIVITRQGELYLQTKLIDSLSHGTFKAEMSRPLWANIESEISKIDSSSFHLLRSEVSDTYMLHVIVYDNGLPMEFLGYDWPMLYENARDLLCCEYKKLVYVAGD